MGASLLAMVCAITAKSKKHDADKPELQTLRTNLLVLVEELVVLAREDALAYDKVVEAMKKKEGANEAGSNGIQAALRIAAEVPLRTATACAEVLNLATRVAALGKKSASSDTVVAILLAEAGLKGAVTNVRINTRDMNDSEFVKSSGSRVASLERTARMHTREAMALVR